MAKHVLRVEVRGAKTQGRAADSDDCLRELQEVWASDPDQSQHSLRQAPVPPVQPHAPHVPNPRTKEPIQQRQ